MPRRPPPHRHRERLARPGPLVRKVTFTGSDATRRHINHAAARDIQHVSLELGGK
uniref:aldehyde dehydrogenase family protein n=1 Tax=Streptomyces brasiliscabiei TaxID=2736302 RepID=UPI0027DFC496